MVEDSIYVILIFGFLGVVTNGIAWKSGFYQWTPLPAPKVMLKHVFSIFAIYVGTTFFLVRYLAGILQQHTAGNPTVATLVLLQFFVILAMSAALVVYCKLQPGGVFGKVWKNPAQSPQTSPLFDFLLGVAAWLVAFPVVQVVGELFDVILLVLYRMESYEQVAVRYLKTTMEAPLLTILALISIVIIAPIVEEFLFRGTLQSYFKKKLGVKKAIILSGLCFAFFHYSPDQGYGNLSLIPSLFAFACFLGYIYERQGSLYASIGLHMTFNFISSIRILFSPE